MVEHKYHTCIMQLGHFGNCVGNLEKMILGVGRCVDFLKYNHSVLFICSNIFMVTVTFFRFVKIHFVFGTFKYKLCVKPKKSRSLHLHCHLQYHLTLKEQVGKPHHQIPGLNTLWNIGHSLKNKEHCCVITADQPIHRLKYKIKIELTNAIVWLQTSSLILT